EGIGERHNDRAPYREAGDRDRPPRAVVGNVVAGRLRLVGVLGLDRVQLRLLGGLLGIEDVLAARAPEGGMRAETGARRRAAGGVAARTPPRRRAGRPSGAPRPPLLHAVPPIRGDD